MQEKVKKSNKKKYKSKICRVIYQMINDCYRIGIVSEETMQHFRDSCLVKENESTNCNDIHFTLQDFKDGWEQFKKKRD